MRVFVLAGGLGTRMFPLNEVIPKCLLPVAGKPCCRWIVERLMRYGFDDIALCINKWAEDQFQFAFKDLKNVNFSVSEVALGTAGELFWARKLIDSTFMIQYGDDLTDVPYRDLIEFHKEHNAEVTLAATTNMPLEVGVLDVDEEGRLIRFEEKPPIGRPIWTSVSVFEPIALLYFKVDKDLAKDVIPEMMGDERRIYVYMTDSLWLDVGSIGHWRLADKLMREGKV